MSIEILNLHGKGDICLGVTVFVLKEIFNEMRSEL